MTQADSGGIVMEWILFCGIAIMATAGLFFFSGILKDRADRIVLEARLREALMWATAYLECNCKNSTKDMPDFLNAVALVDPGKDLVGPFQMLVAENEDLREQLSKLS